MWLPLRSERLPGAAFPFGEQRLGKPLTTEEGPELLFGETRSLQDDTEALLGRPIFRTTGRRRWRAELHAADSTLGLPDPLRQSGLPDEDIWGEPIGANALGSHHSLNHLRLECFDVLSHLGGSFPAPATQPDHQTLADQTG